MIRCMVKIMNDLEQDLQNNPTILAKINTSEVYSQNLYAALCNNRFFYNDKEWTCSWRMAGGIVSDLRKGNGYMDWYCSGLIFKDGFVGEGVVTDEIRMDLLRMGWVVKPYEPRLKPGIYRNDWGGTQAYNTAIDINRAIDES